eukprot:353933-Chlamydomonas_euryale.AAC.9
MLPWTQPTAPGSIFLVGLDALFLRGRRLEGLTVTESVAQAFPDVLSKGTPSPTPWTPCRCNAHMCVLCECIFVSPTQVSSAPGQSVRYWSALHCVREMVAREGFASLYRGCAVNIMKTAPGAAIQFVAYDFIKTSIVAIDPRAGVQSPL